ncbi:RHS repeat-associated core domain-containing protein [Pseudomonas lurida]|uniref:RHS repeat-associated core domain-containing protein n=1 Tax=Pseudomonas lurida TaxID=244566 RepID=UPI001F28D64D|nr:RHS repeat-associated core domain-containing protein [Pseudomonas lurida]MCF5026653.1 type IV secretion protein Rhs [Pseudomonas lurida]MCF5310250.1 type IV secretion protein Rhs [Pseudomonas lurida]MCF5323601.1 type IV secretion protein Rhs [Pseudomonas lurida]
MSDALWAARLGDSLLHTSVMADILGGVLEIAANIAITAVATAAIVAATGITVVTGGLGCFVLGAVVGIIVGIGMSKTGADKGLTKVCEWIGNALFPPVVMATIATGSHNTFTNGIPSARAAGAIGPVSSQPAEGGSPEEASYLDMAKGFFSQMWRPTVAVPAPGAVPKPLDIVICTKHPPMPPQFIAEGSSKVTINGQPAARSGDRSTCDASIVESGMISSNVRIGGSPVVVREIRSGKTPGVGLAVTALLMLRGGGSKFFSKLPCMVVGGLVSWGTSQVTNAISSAVVGSPNPVHSSTGAKILDGEDDLDFVLPGLLPIEWQRYYSSRDERRNGLFGASWSVIYEVFVEIGAHPEGGERLVYTDEQARQIDMGAIPLGGAVFSAGEGLSVRRNTNGQLLIESVDGLYRLFEPTPGTPSQLRLSQLGDRNDNRIFLNYDDQGRLSQLRDTFDHVRVELGYSQQWPARVERVDRVYPDHSRETLVSYAYDTRGDLAEVRDAAANVQRRFAYDAGQRMIEHQLPTGLRCYYHWECVEDSEWRVVRHWTDEGDEYRFDYDLSAGVTRITDGLQRVSTRRWNPQYQITEYTDNLGKTWQFEWNEDRQLLSATDPQGGKWQFGYDESGNLCSTQDPLGRIESTLWLEHWSLPLVETDAAGHAWQYQYDQRGNCVSEIDPLGHATRYRYDTFGQVIEIIDATGKSKTLRWNETGQLIQHIDCSGYPTAFEYDRQGHLQVVVDALGERQRYRHDGQGRLLQTEMPDGRTEQYLRDTSGLLIGYTDAAGHTTRYQYGRRGQVRQRIDAHGRQIEFRYDAYGHLQTLTNENGESYRFTWDPCDRLVEQQDLDGSARRYAYDLLDNVAAVEYVPNGQTPEPSIVHRLERDAVGRLLLKQTDDGRTEYAYDPLDQLTAVTFIGNDETTQALAFAYDARGQLLIEQSAAGSLNYHYDELGNLIQTQLPDGRWLNRLYYGSGHLHQINLDGRVICDFERDRLHREVLRTQGQITTRSEYDRSGRLRSRIRRPNGQPTQLPAAQQKHFDYDPADNLIGRLERDRDNRRDQHQLLHYDATGRIIASQDDIQGQRETFAYDAAANLLDGPQANAGLVVHNKLLTYQDKRYRYDGFGRMIEKRSAARGVQYFAYDAEHRLIEVRSQKDGRETVVNMTYDPLGRRIAKTEHDSNGYPLGETRFDWEGLRLLQEHRHSQTSLYIYEEDGYAPLARVDGTGEHQSVRYYHNDLNGLPEQLTEADGKTVWQARYQVWGNAAEEVREAYFIEEQNLRFQGQYLDREVGLHYNTFRFYDPDVGRFTTPDPIGLMGGLNLYQYAPNPIGWIDPWGWAGDPAKATHITYVGVKDGKPYVGYASKPGLGHSAQDVLNYRYPNKDIFDVAPRAVFKGNGQEGKDIARGLEQRIYEDKLKEGPVANKQRPVGPKNKRRDIYLAAADKHRGVKPQKPTSKPKGPGRC